MLPSSNAGSPRTPEDRVGLAEVLSYFSGAFMMMLGHPEGLRRLDISPDGFWRSFLAIPVALPAAALSWLEYERVERQQPVEGAGAGAIYLAHALSEGLAWILPIIVLALIARPLGYGRTFAPLVIASNWGSALLAWAMVPIWLLLILLGQDATSGVIAFLLTAVMVATLVLSTQLIRVAIGGEFLSAIGIVVLMIVSALLAFGMVMEVTGIPLM